MDKHPLDSQGEQLLGLCKRNRLRILNGRTKGDRVGHFTRFPLSYRESPSTLDYIVADLYTIKLIESFRVLHHIGMSDHDCLLASIKTKGFRAQEAKNSCLINVIKRMPFRYETPEKFIMKLKSPLGKERLQDFIKTYEFSEGHSISNLSSDFVQLIADLSKANPSKRARRKRGRCNHRKNNKSPWYSSECNKVKRELCRTEKCYKKDPFNRQKQDALFSIRKRYKRICRETERRFREQLTSQLLAIENKKPEEFWGLIKKMRNWGKPGGADNSSIDPSMWLEYFKKLLNEGPETPTPFKEELHALENQPAFSSMDFRFTTTEIEKALKRLNVAASPGVDQVSGKLLVSGKEELIPLYHLFYNKIFSFATQPECLSLNKLNPIFKKGDPENPDNYRGIAVGSAIGKIFDLLILDRLETRVQHSHPLSPNQIGFKKGHRTSDHIFVLKSIVDKIIKKDKGKLYVAFIDFRKAYDRINRSLLLLKLQRLGINGLFHRNIKEMCNSISYQVVVRDGLLEPIKSRYGLKQGGVLSPLLFNLYVDDMKFIFDDMCDPVEILEQPLSHLLFADDLILLSTSEPGLKHCLSKLEEYCLKWQLELNIDKSKIMVFNAAGRLLPCQSFLFLGKRLEQVKSYCYLGIDFICSGSFRTARKNLTEKAEKATLPLMSVVSQFNLPYQKAIKLFDTLVRPIALYNSENLTQMTFHQIQSLHLKKTNVLSLMESSYTSVLHFRYLKFVLGVKRNCSNMATLGETGEFPLHLHGLLSLLKFWHRTTLMPSNTLVRQALGTISQPDCTFSEWISTVKVLLSYLGLDEYFHNPLITNTANFTKICAGKLKEKVIEQWQASISDNMGRQNTQGNKLRFYKIFKKHFCREPYLEFITNFHLRKQVAKFRCSDHSLEIEIGRHKKIQADQRFCKFCVSKVETELHFLNECPAYNNVRQIFLRNYDNWQTIIKCEDKITAHCLAIFLTKAFHHRENLLALPT